MKIAALFRQENALPTIPGIIQELIESFTNDGVSVDQIASKIAVDPVLSANVLRLANSPYYRVSRQICSVDAAVTMLGFVTVRTLVITCSLVTRFKTTPGMDLRQFWRYSLSTAVAAKWLAQHTAQSSRMPHDEELAFTIGIIHALGELLMHLAMTEEFTTLDKIVGPLDVRRLKTERDAFGFDYSEVSAELALRWKFPETMIAAIHAFPRPLDQKTFLPMAAIIHLAVWLVRVDENHISAEEIRASFPAPVAESLGINPTVILEQMPPLAELRAGIEELIP